jgi:hypothetical protein
MYLTIHDLKVDQTVLPMNDNSGIFVTNINIPEQNLNTNLDNVIQRARDLIVNDYIGTYNIQFQVCATYELRNTENGDERQWTGSFNPKGNQLNSLCPFNTFNQNFETIVKDSCSPENVYNKLRFYHAQTNWVFHKLTSAIISVQSVVNQTHPTILRKSLLARRHGSRRAIYSFLLP